MDRGVDRYVEGVAHGAARAVHRGRYVLERWSLRCSSPSQSPPRATSFVRASATRGAVPPSARPRSSPPTTPTEHASRTSRTERRRRDLRLPQQDRREPCIRANNLNTGRAFEFETNGTEVAGSSKTPGAPSRPMPPGRLRWTGRQPGAGRVDRAAHGNRCPQPRRLILRSCWRTRPSGGGHVGPELDAHVLEPDRRSLLPRRQRLRPGDNFQIMSAGNDDRPGTPTSSPAARGVTFQSEEAMPSAAR